MHASLPLKFSPARRGFFPVEDLVSRETAVVVAVTAGPQA
jgi:hypothetical protein